MLFVLVQKVRGVSQKKKKKKKKKGKKKREMVRG